MVPLINPGVNIENQIYLRKRRDKKIETRVPDLPTRDLSAFGLQCNTNEGEPVGRWCRCRESNPGHYGYEPYALAI